MKNYTLKRLFLEGRFEEYLSYFKHAKPKSLLCRRKGNKLIHMSFGEVQVIKSRINNGDMIGAMSLAFSWKRKKYIVFGGPVVRTLPASSIIKTRAIEFFTALNHVREEVNKIITAEQSLQGEYNMDWEKAGAEELDQFGPMNALISIAKDYHTTPDVVETWPYQRVFTLLLHNKVSAEVNERYAEIIRTK